MAVDLGVAVDPGVLVDPGVAVYDRKVVNKYIVYFMLCVIL